MAHRAVRDNPSSKWAPGLRSFSYRSVLILTPSESVDYALSRRDSVQVSRNLDSSLIGRQLFPILIIGDAFGEWNVNHEVVSLLGNTAYWVGPDHLRQLPKQSSTEVWKICFDTWFR